MDHAANDKWAKILQALLAAAFTAWAAVVWDLGQTLRADIAQMHRANEEHIRIQAQHDVDTGERLGRLESTARTNVERIDRLETRVDNAVARSK